MRYILCLLLIMAMPFARAGKAIQANPFIAYQGKYRMTIRGQTGYINLITKKKQLTLVETWTNNEYPLKHLTGDNFIVEVRGWSAKFNRDKKGQVVSVLVMGRDLWTKVK